MERSIFNRKLQRAMAKILKSNKKPNILLGIGHNSDRFLQITKMHNRFDSFVDGDLKKNGLYLANTNCPITNQIRHGRNTNMNVIIGVHDRNYQEILTQLKRVSQCTNDFNI